MRSCKLNGKSFQADNKKGKFDSQKHYGKSYFSSYVVRVDQEIDFSKFRDLLKQIESVIEHHNKIVRGGIAD